MSIPNGFLPKEEIKANYLSSYIYLLSITDEFEHPAITMANLFEGERGIAVFLGLLRSKYTKSTATEILANIGYNE